MLQELLQKLIHATINLHFECISKLPEMMARCGWRRHGISKFEHLKAGQQLEVWKFCGGHFCSQIAPCHHVPQALDDKTLASFMASQGHRGLSRNWHEFSLAQVCQSQAGVASVQAPTSCKEPLEFPFERVDLLNHLL